MVMQRETTSRDNASRMELHELHILQRQARPCDHAATIAGAGMGRSGGEIRAAIATRRQDHHLGREQMQCTVI